MQAEYLQKYRETNNPAYRIISLVLLKPQDQAEASLRRLVAWTVHPERRPFYAEALEKLVEGCPLKW